MSAPSANMVPGMGLPGTTPKAVRRTVRPDLNASFNKARLTCDRYAPSRASHHQRRAPRQESSRATRIDSFRGRPTVSAGGRSIGPILQGRGPQRNRSPERPLQAARVRGFMRRVSLLRARSPTAERSPSPSRIRIPPSQLQFQFVSLEALEFTSKVFRQHEVVARVQQKCAHERLDISGTANAWSAASFATTQSRC